MLFGRKKERFAASVRIFSEKGYCDEYISELEREIGECKKPAEIADGQSRLANALLFNGELKKAANVYADTDIKKIPAESVQSFAANRLLCLFLLNRFREAGELYHEYNKEILSEKGVMMKRSVGIYEFISERYDSAVTVFIKLAGEVNDSRGTIMADICLVRALLKLDLTDIAAETAVNFSVYENRNELTEICRKLSKKIFNEASAKKKTEIIRNRKK